MKVEIYSGQIDQAMERSEEYCTRGVFNQQPLRCNRIVSEECCDFRLAGYIF